MNYKLTDTTSILRSDGAFIPADPENTDYQAYLAWLAEGNTPEPADNPTQVQIIAAITATVQAHMDAAAQAMGYDDIKTAVTYADEPAVPRFQAEGQALRAWRSLVWAKCYQLLDEVQAGMRGLMSPDQVVAELPPRPNLAHGL